MFKGNWNKKLTKLFIYLSGYVSFIAFSIVGGCVLLKSYDDDLKKTTKRVFIISLIYYGLLAIFSIFGLFGGMNPNYYGSGFYQFVRVMTNIIEIAKIVVFAGLMIYEMVKKDNDKQITDEDNDTKQDDNEVDAEIVEQ